MPRILIADDSEATRYSMSKILSGAGYDVYTAHNGEEALHQFKKYKPDILITDLNMPVMDGFELAREIRSIKKYSHVPIIFVSAAYKEMTSKIKAMDIGGNDFLTHPVDRDELLFKIKAMLRNKDLYDELLKSREALRRNEIKYHTLFDNATDAIYLIGAETHRIVDCNSKASQMTGYSVKELMTMSVEDLSPVEEQDVVSKIFGKIIKKGALSGISGISQVCKDGTLIPVEFNATTVKVGKTRCCLCIYRDITERTGIETALKKSEDKYRSLFKHMSLGCALHKIVLNEKKRPVDFVFIEVNDAFEKLTGLKRADVVGKRVSEIIPKIGESKFDWVGEFGKVAIGGEILQSEQYVEALNRWYSISAYRPLEFHFMVLFDDITERKQWEEKIRESEARFRDVAENAIEWIWEVDASGKYTYASPVVEKVLGYRPEEIIGNYFYDLFHPDDKKELKEAAFKVFSSKEPLREFVNRNIHKNGQTVWLSTSGIPVLDGKGELTGYRGTDTDITSYKITEERLLREEEKWAKTFDTIPDLIAIMDNEHRVVNANRALLRKLGTTKEKLKGSFCYEVIHGTHNPPSFCPHSSALKSGKENIREVYEENLRGYYIVSASPIFDSQNNPIGVVEVARDITDRKKLEEQLKEAAIRDELTGLFNRRGFKTFAHKLLTLANRKRQMISLVYLDIDDMKTINDEHGHLEGDRALTDTAHVIRSAFRQSDIMARIGGDEFAVLLVDHSLPDMESIVIRNIRNQMMKVNSTPGRACELSLSIGLATYNPDAPCSIDELMSRADALMYEQKKEKHGKGTMRPQEKEFIEKRSFPRYSAGVDYWAILDSSERSRIIDISLGGIRINSEQFLNVDSIHTLHIIAPDHENLEYSATVVRSRPVDAAVAAGKAANEFETAFKFGEVHKRGVHSLEDVISTLSN